MFEYFKSKYVKNIIFSLKWNRVIRINKYWIVLIIYISLIKIAKFYFGKVKFSKV